MLLVGAGEIARQKLPNLLDCQAQVHVVAPEALPDIQAKARDGKIQWSARSYIKTDMKGASLVIAATNDAVLQKKIVKDAHARGIWVNVVDVPALCDFIAPAVIGRGDIQIAISTGGAAPALAKYLRRKLEPLLGQEYEEFARMVKKWRPDILKLPKDERTTFWQHVVSDSFFDDIRSGGIAAAETRIKEWIHGH